MKAESIKKNQKVFWHDPDDRTCSNSGVVCFIRQPISDESIVGVNLDAGGFVECYPHELSEF